MIVTDEDGSAGISPQAGERVRRASSVEWAVMAGPLVDSSLATLPSTAIPTRQVDALPGAVNVVAGRWPDEGEATIPVEVAETVGLAGPWGSLLLDDGAAFAIVAFTDLDDETVSPLQGTAFIAAPAEELEISRLIVQVDRPSSIASTVEYVKDASTPVDPSTLAIEATDSAALVRLEVVDDLRRNRARAGLAALIVAVVLSSLNGLALVSGQRKRLGLTRALGATRSRVAWWILAFLLLTSGLGSLVGVAVTAPGQQILNGALPPASFLVATVLAVATSSLAGGLVPAVAAGRQDPVRVLRSP